MSHFGRGMDANVHWYDTKNTAILRECYGKEFRQRGFAPEPPPDITQIPSDQLARMYPTPHRAVPDWKLKEDVNLMNRTLNTHRTAVLNNDFGRRGVTAKVGDVGAHKHSTLKMQQLEEVRHSGFMDMFTSSKGEFPSPEDIKAYRTRTKRSSNGNVATVASDETVQKAMLKIAPETWTNASSPDVRPLSPACMTTHASTYCDPAPFKKIAGMETVNRGTFKKKSERSEYQEARIIQSRLLPSK